MLKLFFNREDTISSDIAASLEIANLTLLGRMERMLEQDAQRKLRCQTVLCDKATTRRMSYYS